MHQPLFARAALGRIPSRLRSFVLPGFVLVLSLLPGPRNGPLGAGGVRSARAADGDQQWEGLGSNAPNDVVMALTVWRGELIAGGFFTQAGGTPAAHIAAFDGQSWHALGSGMDGVAVYSLAVYQDDLIAGGGFDTAGGNPASNIARWDGTSWTPLGTGTDAVVWSLSVHDADLIAGGLFMTAGGAPASGIAQWDGTRWSEIGGGMHAQQGNVLAVLTLGDFQGDLIAGGAFETAGGASATNIARWDGSRWHGVAGGTNGIVYAQAIDPQGLILGGAFTRAGYLTVGRIVGWSGSSWFTLGQGVAGVLPVVDALSPVGTALILGGIFSGAGGRPASEIATWDGSSYAPLGSGTNDVVRTLCLYDSQLYVGGSFDIAGNQYSPYLARWNPPQTDGVTQGNPGVLSAVPLRADASPNPFRSSTRLRFALAAPPGEVHVSPAAASGEVDIYDLLGRQVSRLTGRVGSAGLSADWDGRDAGGRTVPPGIYLARLRAGGVPLKLTRTR